ncbi:unnamed protein product [Gadus morhua 'NCC']
MWLWAPASGLLEGGLDRRSRTDGVEVDEVVSNSINPSSARRCWELRQHHCIEPEGNARFRVSSPEVQADPVQTGASSHLALRRLGLQPALPSVLHDSGTVTQGRPGMSLTRGGPGKKTVKPRERSLPPRPGGRGPVTGGGAESSGCEAPPRLHQGGVGVGAEQRSEAVRLHPASVRAVLVWGRSREQRL